MEDKIEETVRCNTVGELLDALACRASTELMDAQIEGPGGETFTGFKVVRRTLSDKSEVLDFELFED
jgi:hypothetical protein